MESRTIFFLGVALLYILNIHHVSCQTIYSRLGATDAARVTTLTALTDRALGLLEGTECLNEFFQSPPVFLRDNFIAFLCTAFGGNSIANPTNISACEYNHPSGGLLFSENATELYDAMLVIHQPLHISIAQGDAFNAALGAVIESFGILSSTVLYQDIIAAVTPALDNAIRNPADASKPCATVQALVDWQVPITVSANVPVNGTIGWIWKDKAPHTVQDQNNPNGWLGFGASSNTLTDDPTMICSPTLSGVCYLNGTGPPSYYRTFKTAGTWTAICGFHGNIMTTNIIVGGNFTGITTGTANSTSSAATSGTGSSGGGSTDDKQKLRVGLGVGLTLGIVFCFCLGFILALIISLVVKVDES